MLSPEAVSDTIYLPWSGRTPQQWKAQVTQKEAGRLLYFAQRKSQGNSFIEDWDLSTPFQVFFSGEIDKLSNFWTRSSDAFRSSPTSVEHRDTIIGELDQVFTHPLTYSFLSKAREVYTHNMGSKKHKRVEEFVDVPSQVGRELNWDQQATERANVSYNAITTSFWDDAQRFAGIMYRKSPSQRDYEDWVGIAGERLSTSVARFYWETYAVDPGATIEAFLDYLKSTIHDPETEKFQVKASTFDDTWMQNGIKAPSVEDLAMAQMEVAEIGVNIEGVNKEPDFWGPVFGDVDSYRELYQKRRMTVQPFRRKYLDAFFEMQTGDLNITLDLMQERFSNVQRYTLRRQVNKGINILLGKEGAGERGQELKKGGPGKRHLEYRLFSQALKDPGIRAQFAQKDLEMIQLYYLDEPEQTVKAKDVATQLGVHECTISRRLVWAKQTLESLLADRSRYTNSI